MEIQPISKSFRHLCRRTLFLTNIGKISLKNARNSSYVNGPICLKKISFAHIPRNGELFHRRILCSGMEEGVKKAVEDVGFIETSEDFKSFQGLENAPTFEHLHSYLDVCVNNGNIQQAHRTLLQLTVDRKFYFGKKSANLFNVVLHGWARKENWKMVIELMSEMEKANITANLQSYCAVIEGAVCTGRSKNDIEEILKKIECQTNLNIENLLEECVFESDQLEIVLKGIQLVKPHFHPKQRSIVNLKELDPVILEDSNRSHFSFEHLKEFAQSQLSRESSIQVPVKSIKKPISKDFLHWRKIWNEFETSWRQSLLEAFKENLAKLENKAIAGDGSRLSLHPYLVALRPEEYVDIIMQKVRNISREPYATLITLAKKDLGDKVMKRYLIQKKEKNGVFTKFEALYQKFCEYHADSNIASKYTPREFWECLQASDSKGPTLHDNEILWPTQVIQGIGLFLFEILMKNVLIDINLLNHKSEIKNLCPAFNVLWEKGARVRRHPVLGKLFHFAYCDEFMTFDATSLPMISPPLPWTSFRNGGFLTSSVPVIRLSTSLGIQYRMQLENTDHRNMFACFDALNKLSSCPWKINEQLLDLAIEIFSTEGNPDIGIPLLPVWERQPTFSLPNVVREPRLNRNREMLSDTEMTSNKKRKKRERKQLKEMFFALSIANKFRKDIFWVPHNADFRGRAYPCTEYFKHLGTSVSDVVASLFLFANGKELGSTGIEWLKIHLINLTGFHKRASLEERLNHCDKLNDLIMDSADNPLKGKRWWMKSKNPWQTLACCIELTKCLRSPNPTKYVCHLPVHQDGSSNMLQHYAALGRDESCAALVNLLPEEKPQDVYNILAERIELERKKDASENLKIAQLLDGFISRNLVKPYVIAMSYGASEHGCFIETFNYFNKELKAFPFEHQQEAAAYVTKKASLFTRKMFSSVKKIQHWLSKSANLITSMYLEPVQWISPLGFPVIQPHQERNKDEDQEAQGSYWECMEADLTSTTSANVRPPDVERQMKSFPPNYIHNLEATHMMLTALRCQREMIEFASVHDCFWTLPSSVDSLNKIIREEFVALHSQPLLSNLSKCLAEICVSPKDSETLISDNATLMKVLSSPPLPGKLDLQKVLQSTYFFS